MNACKVKISQAAFFDLMNLKDSSQYDIIAAECESIGSFTLTIIGDGLPLVKEDEEPPYKMIVGKKAQAYIDV